LKNRKDVSKTTYLCGMVLCNIRSTPQFTAYITQLSKAGDEDSHIHAIVLYSKRQHLCTVKQIIKLGGQLPQTLSQ
jgi:hypothetical protein